MKIKDAINMANLMEQGNVLPKELAILFLSELDGMIQSDIMLHAPEEIVSYDNEEQELLLRPPHDKIYVHYLVMMIRNQQQEYEGYQNSQESVDEKLKTFRRWYVQHYRPADTDSRSYTGGTSADAFGFAYLTAYGIAVKLGYQGTEEEWIESLHGAKGDTGEAARMRFDAGSGMVQWGVEGEWYDLFALSELVDPMVEEATRQAQAAQAAAEGSARAAANDAVRAQQYMEQAGLHAQAADVSAQLAEDAKTAAEGSAQTAANDAMRAQQCMERAALSAQAADVSAQLAEDAQTAAESAALDAQTRARSAENAAQMAEEKANAANLAKDEATAAARQAADRASSAGGYALAAEQGANRAEAAAKRAEDAVAGGNGSGENPDLTGAVQTVNGQAPDENGNVEIGFSVETGYLNATASGLLISILEKAMFTADQSANITALKNALALKDVSGTTGTGGSGGTGGGGGDTSVGFTWVAGTTESKGDWSSNNANSKTRMTPYKTNGVFATKIITDANAQYIFDGDIRGQLYLPVIPSGVTTMTIVSANIKDFIPLIAIAPALFSADGTRLYDPGYNVSTIDLTQYPDAVYYGANIKKNDGSAFTAEEYAWISEYLSDFTFT